MNTKQILMLREYAILGALVFWVPDIIVHAVRRNGFGGIDILCLSVLLPLLTCITVVRVWRTSREIGEFLNAGLAGVLGIWLFGPFLMMVSASFSGGGFATRGAWQTALLGTALFPMFTFMMSTYDGTLFAVMIATATLPLMSLILKHRVQPAPLPNTK